jgi:hypothetical protein
MPPKKQKKDGDKECDCWCVHCKEKSIMIHIKVDSTNAKRPMLRGVCKKCDGKVVKFISVDNAEKYK